CWPVPCRVMREQAAPAACRRVGVRVVVHVRGCGGVVVGVVASVLWLLRLSCVGWLWWLVGLWVENCIVDASILLCGQVCKGGCVDALAPGADEGRGRPR